MKASPGIGALLDQQMKESQKLHRSMLLNQLSSLRYLARQCDPTAFVMYWTLFWVETMHGLRKGITYQVKFEMKRCLWWVELLQFNFGIKFKKPQFNPRLLMKQLTLPTGSYEVDVENVFVTWLLVAHRCCHLTSWSLGRQCWLRN